MTTSFPALRNLFVHSSPSSLLSYFHPILLLSTSIFLLTFSRYNFFQFFTTIRYNTQLGWDRPNRYYFIHRQSWASISCASFPQKTIPKFLSNFSTRKWLPLLGFRQIGRQDPESVVIGHVMDLLQHTIRVDVTVSSPRRPIQRPRLRFRARVTGVRVIVSSKGVLSVMEGAVQQPVR